MKLYLLLFFLLMIVHAYAKPINSTEAISIGGIKQWIKFKGDDDKAPVLLLLHGGPGNSMMAYAEKFTNQLTKHFIVVLWDQRESGKTATLNKSQQSLTVSLFVNDAVEVINYLRKKFDQEKIFLLGHSWGGYLGLQVAMKRPELLTGYFALSPMINQLESERKALQVMRSKAQKEKNQEAILELDKIKIPFESGEQLYYHRKWLSHLMKTKTPSREAVENWAVNWLALFNEACLINFNNYAPELKCPVYFLIGRHDYQTNFSIAEDYYQKVSCEKKNLYWFEQSAHSPHMTETTKFQNIIIDIKNKH